MKPGTPRPVSTSRNISKPNFMKLANPDDAIPYKPMIGIGHPPFKSHETIFKIIGENKNGLKIELISTPHIVVNRYYLLRLIEHIVICSTRYKQK